MAANNRTLTRIYDLRVLGGDKVTSALRDINRALEENARLKAIANKSNVSASDLAEIAKYKERIKELTIEELRLKAAQKEATNEKKALATATVEAANAAKKQKDSLTALAGSYTETKKLMAELRPLIQNANKDSEILFQGRKLNFSQAIDEYKKLSAAEQDFRRQFTKDNTLVGEYTSGIIQAFQQSGLDQVIRNQVQKTKEQLNSLDTNFEKLKQELQAVGQTGQGGFDRIEREMIENRNEANRLRASIAGIEQQMQNTGGLGSRITASLNSNFANLRNTIIGVAAGYVGFQAALNKGTQLISDASEISDQLTELKVNMGQTAEQSEKLQESLSKINTRTSLKGLLEIADVAVKAGVANENLISATEAIDKVKVAFGKDFGSIEQGTETFAKLISIFYEDGEITGDRIMKVGNSIRAIANESVASVPYITDFNGRMAGLKQVFKDFTLAQSTGLAAGFEQFKQSAEVSSTVLVKVLPKLASDTQKYGAIVGKTAEEFGELINNNPVEALIQVSEALVKNGKGVEEISAALADSELGSGRITTILATLGGKADVFRDRIGRAGQTIQSTDAIVKAFTEKNDNLAGTLDKIKKNFDDIAGAKSFRVTLEALAVVLFQVLKLLPLIVLALTAYAAAQLRSYIITKAATEGHWLHRAALFAKTAQLALSNIQQSIANTITALSISLQIRSATATGLAAVGWRVLGVAVRFAMGPFGVVLGLVTALVTVVGVLSARADNLAASFRSVVLQNKYFAETLKEARLEIAAQVNEMKTLVSTSTDLELSIGSRQRALEKLIALSPEYLSRLTLENIATDEGRQILERYNTALEAQARIKAAKNITGRLSEEKERLEMIKQEIELYKNTPIDLKSSAFRELSDDAQKFLQNTRGATPEITAIRNLDKQIEQKNVALQAATKNLLNQEKNASDAYRTFLFQEIVAAQKAMNAIEDKNSEQFLEAQARLRELTAKFDKEFNEKKSTTGATGTTISKAVEVDIEKLKAQIKALNDQIEIYKGSQEGLNKLIKDRDALQKKLDEALGNKRTGGAGSGNTTTRTERLKQEYEAEKKTHETLFNDKKITEEQFNNSMINLAVQFRENKLAKIKAANQKEKEQQISFNADLAKDQAESNKKLFDLLAARLQATLESKIAAAKALQEDALEDRRISEPDKLKENLAYLKAELDAKREFNAAMLLLERRFGIDNVLAATKRRDDLAAIERQIRQTAYDVAVASYKERLRLLENFKSSEKATIETDTANNTREILSDPKKSDRQKANEIKELELQQTKRLLDLEVEITKQAYEEMRRAYAAGTASYEDMVNARAALAKARLAQEEFVAENEQGVWAQLTSGLKNAWSNLTGFMKGVKASNAEIKSAIAEAKQTINSAVSDAMDSYWQGQNEEVEKRKEVALQQLQIEEEQKLAVAQSEDEKDSIRRQFEAKRKEQEKKSAEERKQVALKQMSIEFGLAVLKTLATYPFPFSLIPVAGLTIAYMLQRSAVQRQKFAKGGMPKHGGDIKGKSHAEGGVPFNYEAEDGELAIINKRSSTLNKKFTVTGTPRQIASAINQVGGGVNFASGARIRKLEYGGYLGTNSRAPVDLTFLKNSDTSSNNGFDEVNRQFGKVYQMLAVVSEQTNKRIDRIKVDVVAQEVVNTDEEIKRAKAVGSLN